MIILGIHTGHDASLALIKDGKILGAISIERFSKVKKDSFITWDNFKRFLDDFKVTLNDIDYITMGYWNKEYINFMDIYSPKNEKYPLMTYGRYGMESQIINHLDPSLFGYNYRVDHIEGYGFTLPPMLDRIRPPYASAENTHRNSIPLNVIIDGYDRVIPGYFVDHHVAHASSSFFTSSFENAAIFTADASMNEHTSCSGYFYGNHNTLNILRSPGYTYGNFYDVATEYLGVGPGITKAGTLMGLSSYGEVSANAKEKWMEWTKPFWERGGTEDMHWCDWIFLQMTGKFPYVGSLRPEIANKEHGYEHFSRDYQQVFTKEQSDTKEVMDMAADVQYVAERSLVKYSQDLYKESKTINDGNLCLSGGIMLNCNANYKMMKESGFKNIHFFPACGDDGISIGSALHTYHLRLSNDRVTHTNADLMYLGPDYDYYPKGNFLAKELNIDVVADRISKGDIVCWFQGRSEFGPRALGNRSFITDPRNPDMKDILNSRVKYREWYRPFAPVVLNEHKEEWFNMDFESPFMLHTVPCKKPQEIPSVVHIDNTSRVQTIKREDNPRFYGLIESFYEKTGIPVVMNTSLNVKGQPIVETPDDAMELFTESDVDILVINDVMYFRD